MDDATRECFIARLKLVLMNVRLCNSACDVHEVGQIRNVASMLLQELEDNSLTLQDKQVNAMICRAEKKCVEYFQKRFGSAGIKK